MAIEEGKEGKVERRPYVRPVIEEVVFVPGEAVLGSSPVPGGVPEDPFGLPGLPPGVSH